MNNLLSYLEDQLEELKENKISFYVKIGTMVVRKIIYNSSKDIYEVRGHDEQTAKELIMITNNICPIVELTQQYQSYWIPEIKINK